VDAEIRNVIKRLEKRKKTHKKLIKNTGKHTKRLGRKEKKTNFKTLKPSLLELKIKKKPTKPKPTMPHPEVIAMGIERKKKFKPQSERSWVRSFTEKKPDLSRRMHC